MEFIFEFIIELLLEGTIEASKNKKISKSIRYPLIIIISLLFITIIGLVIYTGIIILKEYTILGIILILIGLFMFIMSIIKFKKTYIKIKKRNNI